MLICTAITQLPHAAKRNGAVAHPNSKLWATLHVTGRVRQFAMCAVHLGDTADSGNNALNQPNDVHGSCV